MGIRGTRTAWWSGLAAGVAAVVLSAVTSLGTDYAVDTRPAIDALLAHDLGAFASHQPSMGPLSLWLRWPLAELAAALGGGDLAVYRAGALACLLVAAVVIARVAIGSHTVGRSRSDALLVVAVLGLNPVTLRALALGHPEEPLGAALCLAAVLVAISGRATPAGLLLGLALATKQWALFAVLPVLLSLPRTRAAWTAALLPAGAIAALMYLPMLLADPGAFVDALRRPVGGLGEMRPGNLWHAIATQTHRTSIGGSETVAVQQVPGWLQAAAHPGIALVALLTPLAVLRAAPPARRGPLGLERVLALLALVFLLRCWADPWNHEYYHLPMLLALGAYEALGCRRAPVLTAVSSAFLWVLFARLAQPGMGPAIDIAYLAWALPLTAWLAVAAVGAPRAATIAAWTPSRPGTRTPTRGPSPTRSRRAA